MYNTNMKHLLTIRQQDIHPNSPVVDTSNFRQRRAARAVLLDRDEQVYMMKVGKRGFHKLPGGGVDEGETVEQALARELLEEVGCRAEVIAELGTITEYRDYDGEGLEQVSYCYLAKQIGTQGASSLEDNELEDGMEAVKVGSIDEAINILSSDKPDNLGGKFMQHRDLVILKAVKNRVDSGN